MPGWIALIIFWELWKNHLAWMKIWPVLLASASKKRKKMWKWWHFPWLYGLSSFSLYTSRKIAVLRNELKWFSRHLGVVAPTCAGNIRVSMRMTGWWTLGQCEGYSFDTIPDENFKSDWGRSRGTFIGAHLWWNVRKLGFVSMNSQQHLSAVLFSRGISC